MELPSVVPVMTLSNVILFPQAMLPLYIFEPRYRRMLADALESHRMFAVAMQQPGVSRERPASVAGLGLIRASVTNKDGTSNLVLQGIARVELERAVRYRPYRLHPIRPLFSPARNDAAAQALASKVLELVSERLELGLTTPFQCLNEKATPSPDSPDAAPQDSVATQAFREVIKHLSTLEDPEQLADLVSATLLPSPEERQVILETAGLTERLRYLLGFLDREIRRMKQRPTP